MKNPFSFLFIITQLFIQNITAQNIAINETGNIPDTSAMLDISSITKGFLTPRMTTVQRNAIPLPAKGLIVYNTTTNQLNVNTGSSASPVWASVTTSSNTNTLSSSANTITSTVNGVTASAAAVNSVSNTSTINSLSTTINGITGSSVSIINSNVLSLSTASLTNTINGVSSSALDLSPAITSKAWGLSGNAAVAANFLGTTNGVDLIIKTNNTERMRITSAGAITLTGTTAGAITDSVLTINTSTGVIRYLATARFSSGGSGSGWSLNGNSGTSAANYFGTTDAQPLVFKVAGTQAGYLGTTSTYSTVFGLSAYANYQSTAIGANANANTNNLATAIGYNTNARGYQSVALGANAQTANSNDGIAIGFNSNANSYQGIAIGAGAGTSNSNGALAIGVGASASGYQATAMGNGASASGSNSTALGNGATVSTDNYISIGNTSVTAIRGQVNFTTYSDGRFKKNIKEDVPGIDFISKLRPVTYTWDIHKFNAHINDNDDMLIPVNYNTAEEDAIEKKESITYTGFIAQEVEKAAQATGYNFSGVLKPINDKDAYSLSYAEFVVPLVKSTQELYNKMIDQQQLIEVLQTALNELKKEIK